MAVTNASNASTSASGAPFSDSWTAWTKHLGVSMGVATCRTVWGDSIGLHSTVQTVGGWRALQRSS